MQSHTSHALAKRACSPRHIQLAKANLPKTQPRSKQSAIKKAARVNTKSNQSTAPKIAKKPTALGKLLNPGNLQESLKSVGNLRNSLKTWLQYLQQADQLLDTIYVTSNSLKDSGVLEKIVKQRGKNLTTDDFTNILIALMNSPVGNQVFKSMGSKDDSEAPPPQP